MMTTIKWAQTTIAACAIAASSIAPAQSYIGASGAWANGGDVTFDLPTAAVPMHPTDFGDGWALSIQGGWQFAKYGPGWPRAELELGWRSNPVKQFGGEVDVGPGTGRYKSSTLMLNGIYDFDLGNAWRPYLGAGLGWLRSSASNIERSLNQGDCCTGIIDGSDNGLAWQLIAGIGYEIDSGTWLTFDYRYLASAGQMQYGYRVGCVPDGSVCLGQPGTTEARYTSQTLAIGVRHSF